VLQGLAAEAMAGQRAEEGRSCLNSVCSGQYDWSTFQITAPLGPQKQISRSHNVQWLNTAAVSLVLVGDELLGATRASRVAGHFIETAISVPQDSQIKVAIAYKLPHPVALTAEGLLECGQEIALELHPTSCH
jgi:hypothetical protein